MEPEGSPIEDECIFYKGTGIGGDAYSTLINPSQIHAETRRMLRLLRIHTVEGEVYQKPVREILAIQDSFENLGQIFALGDSQLACVGRDHVQARVPGRSLLATGEPSPPKHLEGLRHGLGILAKLAAARRALGQH